MDCKVVLVPEDQILRTADGGIVIRAESDVCNCGEFRTQPFQVVSGVSTLTTGPAAGLADLCTRLAAIEDWLRESPARNTDSMADGVRAAWSILEDLYDLKASEETGAA